MKTVFRWIGIIVCIIVLVCALLWFLNKEGYINPDTGLSKLINNIEEHIGGISDDTQDFLKDEGIIKTPEPSAEPSSAPAADAPVESPSDSANPIENP